MGEYFPPSAPEIHALGWGIMDGIHVKSQSYEKRIKAGIRFSEDIEKEPHYYRFGYFLSNRMKWILGSIGVVGSCL